MIRWFLLLFFLTGCLAPAILEQSPAGLTADALYVDEAIAAVSASRSKPIIGYLYADDQGAFLANQLILYPGIPPPSHSRDPPHIWIGTSLVASFERVLLHDNGAYHGVVQAQGRLEGSGRSGPEGRYQYHMSDATFTVLLPQEIGIRDLIAMPADAPRQLVQVEGDLLLNDQSSILFEQLGSGGVPIPDSRQIKLTYPADPATLARGLISNPNSTVHFGPVQIIGIWHQNVLRPLAYLPAHKTAD